jgi:hypothetical protein
VANSSHLVRDTFDDEADDYVMAALLLTMGAALPAWADDAGNCSWPVPGTAPNFNPAFVATCRRLADQGNATAQTMKRIPFTLVVSCREVAASPNRW